MKKLFTIPFLGLLLACTTLKAQVTAGLIEEFKFNNLYSGEIGIGVSVAMNAGTSFVTDRNNNANSALHINNSGAGATILNLPYGNSARSFSFWVKLDEYNAGGYNFVYSYGSGGNNWANGASVSANNTVQFAWGNDHTAADVTHLGIWKHVVVTYDGTLSKIYSNGILVGTDTKTTWNTQNTGGAIRFGTGAGNERWFKGAIDDFKIYSRAITAAEVAILYGGKPIASYTFNSTYNNVDGNSPFATTSGTSFVTDRHGNANSALRIEQFGTTATIPNLPYGNAARTISVWVTRNTNAGIFDINNIYHYGTGNEGYGLMVTPTAMSTVTEVPSHGATAMTNPLNVWEHFVISYNGTISKVYKNGILLSTDTRNWNTLSSGDIFRLGLTNGGGNNFFDGTVDDLMIYNYALTDTEVTNLYNNTLPAQTIAEYSFNNTYNNFLGNSPFASNSGTSFVTDRHGNANSALNINNTGTTATITGLPYGNSARTISFWAKVNEMLLFFNSTFSYGEGGVIGGSFDAGGLGYLGENGNLFAPTTNLEGVWYYVTYTYDGTTAKIYKDGALISSSEKSWNTINTSDVFRLGTHTDGVTTLFNGVIDDLKIYNYVLTDNQILSLYSNNTLPVNLVSFTAKAQNNAAILNWKTAQEVNNKQFIVYRKGAEGEFTTIGTKQGAGTVATPQSYVFYDNSPLNGINYYKLVQVDNDGKTTDLGIKTLTLNLTPYTVSLYPNPTTNQVNISFTQGTFHSAKLVNVNGQVLQTATIGKTQQTVTFSLSNYPNGLYFIQLQGNRQNSVQKVIKQ